MDKTVFVVATRGRPQNAQRVAEAFKKRQTTCDLFFVVDESDWHLKEYETVLKNFDVGLLQIDNVTGGVARANNLALEILLDDEIYDHYSHFGFMGDDQIPRTDFFDYIMKLRLPMGQGIIYPNDGLAGQTLVTCPIISRNILEILGFFSPPGIIHLYVDNFLVTLGKDIEALYYVEDVLVEHLHPVNRKAAWDEGYYRVNSKEFYENDKTALDTYLNSVEYAQAVDAIRQNMGRSKRT